QALLVKDFAEPTAVVDVALRNDQPRQIERNGRDVTHGPRSLCLSETGCGRVALVLLRIEAAVLNDLDAVPTLPRETVQEYISPTRPTSVLCASTVDSFRAAFPCSVIGRRCVRVHSELEGFCSRNTESVILCPKGQSPKQPVDLLKRVVRSGN